ncbi:MAG: Lrp/AsnC family transcriptional regulator [Candidatus Omnitrophota bacterium]|nr:Lrp/AsnC family transcriptional regulator [Candidatus Omnitrophota bacterium]
MVKEKLTLLDRQILNRLQEDIPLEAWPWQKIARELNIKEAAFLKRVDFLKKKGIIRRIAATFNPKKAGSVSTLVAVNASPLKADIIAKRINAFSEVTHNYLRDNEYNIWFTIVAQSKERIAQIIKKLKQDKDIEKIIELPAKRLFKISVSFKI